MTGAAMPSRDEVSFVQRAAALIDAELFNRRKSVNEELIHEKAKFHGRLESGRYCVSISQMLHTQLQMRAELIWRNLVRAHESLGTELTGMLRGDMKRAWEAQISTSYDELQSLLDTQIKSPSDRPYFSLDETLKNTLGQYFEEIDIYIDVLERNKARESETRSAAPALPRDRPSTTRREPRKLQTQERHNRWKQAYRDLKSKQPGKSGVWYSRQIARMDNAHDRAAETIRKNMKR
jgi:hypothetical protein